MQHGDVMRSPAAVRRAFHTPGRLDGRTSRQSPRSKALRRRKEEVMSNAEMHGRTITLATGQKVTAAPDHGGIHVTVQGHGASVAHVVATAAEAREIAQLLLALADNLDAPKSAA
jgi:hypothetical protein